MAYTDVTPDNKAVAALISGGSARVKSLGQAVLPLEEGTFRFTFSLPKRTDSTSVIVRVYDTESEAKSQVKCSTAAVTIVSNGSPSITPAGMDGWLSENDTRITYTFRSVLTAPTGEWALHVSTAGDTAAVPLEIKDFRFERVDVVDAVIVGADLHPSLANVRQRYAAKSVGGSASTDGAFASFTWDPGQDVTVSHVMSSAVAPSATYTIFGATGANTWNLRLVPNTGTTGAIEFRENTTQRAISANSLVLWDGKAHTISVRVTGTTVAVTLDGVSVLTGSFSSVTWASATYFIGAGAASSSQRHPGAIWNVEGTDHGTAANGFCFLMDEPRTAATFVNTLSGTSVGNAAKGTGRAFPLECAVASTDGRGMPYQPQGPLVYSACRFSNLAQSGSASYTPTLDTEMSDPTGSMVNGVFTAPCAGLAVMEWYLRARATTLTGTPTIEASIVAGGATPLYEEQVVAATNIDYTFQVRATKALTAGQTAEGRLGSIDTPADAWSVRIGTSFTVTFYPTPVVG